MYKAIVIGDVHGRKSWQHVADKAHKYNRIIFLGDYVDIKTKKVSDKDMVKNLLNILEFKKNNPDKVNLLLGNHDVQYKYLHQVPKVSKYNPNIAEELFDIFTEYESYFNFVYSFFDDKIDYVLTHAGITKKWLNWAQISESNVLNKLNTLPILKLCSSKYDYNATDGPLWARPDTLLTGNKYLQISPNKRTYQIVGHTPVTKVSKYKDSYGNMIIFNDCLRFKDFYKFDYTNERIII